MQSSSKIVVFGARGLVGSAVVRTLKAQGYRNILAPTHDTLDLRSGGHVWNFFEKEQPDFVFLCAARVGGIVANSNTPVDFMQDNLTIQNNVLSCAHAWNVEKLLFLGSACAYPKHARCPIHESDLLTGPLETSNECYALAKISGIRLCQAYRQQYGSNFIACMPTNLFGPGDNYDLQNSHVLPGMMRRMHEAKETVSLWGSGNPVREFLYSEDLAEACLFLMDHYNSGELINVGSGVPTRLCDLAHQIAKTVGFAGEIIWDHTKPDGTPNRFLDSLKLFGMGWRPQTKLEDGLKIVYRDFLGRKYAK